ncbi:hypothetical protein [Methanobacterium ferruginis]|uniref:hypothetical protein n=1 Tax=Methanobacterium ferruginis TaxID=710191 RepID=UPI0025741E58|nr:hypothetical protein [Methanobacterium ferruginis]BDZ68445.1 hypothetical protein GCM10025860_18930 [Methanobacterium ferruginis]
MENKGQASAEYLLLLVVLLIIIAAVTIPLVGRSVNNTMATSMTSDGVNAAQTIANAVNLVYANGPGAKRTVNVYIPQQTALTNSANVSISGNFIGMELKNIAGGPYDSSHIKTTWYNSNEDISFVYVYANTNYPVTINPSTTLTSNWYQVTVYWPVGNEAIEVNLTAS